MYFDIFELNCFNYIFINIYVRFDETHFRVFYGLYRDI